jgi:hypothetical protein
MRRARFLETAVLNVFFGAVGENLKLLADMYLTVKNGEWVSRPVLTTRSNSFVERRRPFESMVYGLNYQLVTAFCATTFYNVPTGLGFYPLPKTV